VRTDIPEISDIAIRKALINDFVHRDYSNFGTDNKPGIYDDILVKVIMEGRGIINRLLVILALFAVIPQTLMAAETIILTDDSKRILLTEKAAVFRDGKGIIDAEGLVQGKYEKYRVDNETSYGFTDEAYWVLTKIENTSGVESWIVNLDYPLVDAVDLFIFDVEGLSKSFSVNDDMAYEDRAIQIRTYAFPVKIPPGEKITFAAKVNTEGTMRFPFYISPYKDFLSYFSKENIASGFFLGFLILMILVNILYFIYHKEKAHILLSLFAGAYAVFYSTQNGILFCILRPEALHWKFPVYITSGVLGLLFITYFSYLYLIFGLGIRYKRKFFRFFSYVGLAISASTFFVPPSGALMMFVTYALLAIIPNSLAAVKLIRSNNPHAMNFLLAWSFFVASIVLFSLRGVGLLPTNLFTLYIKEWGVVGLLAFFFVALNYKLKYLSLLGEEAEQRKKAEEEAKAANRAKSDFLANMSHEIRTPLNSVIGFADLLKDMNLSKQQAQYVETIKHSSNSLLEIINDILDFSKIEAGKLELELIKSDIVTITKNAAEILRLQAEKKGLNFHLNIQSDLPRYALIDPVRLRQVLVNLLGNAVKFTEEGKVELGLRFKQLDDRHGLYHFDVADTGIGIEEEKSDKLFKAFSQADTSTTRKFGGTGLGLVISSLLVEKMGGEIHFDSQPGIGTTFRFSIKATFFSSEEQATKAEESKADKPSKKRVINTSAKLLIAEDVGTNMMLIKIIIGKMLREVVFLEAANGKEAVKLTLTEEPDLVFMDVQMPEMNGLEATEKIRESEAQSQRHTPIIALTAEALKNEVDRCLSSGMDDYLSKPVDKASLFSLLKKYLSGSEQS